MAFLHLKHNMFISELQMHFQVDFCNLATIYQLVVHC